MATENESTEQMTEPQPTKSPAELAAMDAEFVFIRVLGQAKAEVRKRVGQMTPAEIATLPNLYQQKDRIGIINLWHKYEPQEEKPKSEIGKPEETPASS